MNKFEFKKSLGQNFLKDTNIINKIISTSDIENNSLIIEIGPGSGALTRELLKTNSKVLCFEIDTRLKEYLDKLDNGNLKVVYKDFLKVDLKEELKDYKYNKLYIIANLPYYITTPIINKIISSNLDVETMVLMVQKEVGERFCAHPKTKNYSSLSIFLQYNFEVLKVCEVSKHCFVPMPKVDSLVIKFKKIEKKKEVKNEKFFYTIIKDSFTQKRKTLKNNLKKYNWNMIYEVLKDEGYSENVRAEEISIDTFVKISNKLS